MDDKIQDCDLVSETNRCLKKVGLQVCTESARRLSEPKEGKDAGNPARMERLLFITDLFFPPEDKKLLKLEILCEQYVSVQQFMAAFPKFKKIYHENEIQGTLKNEDIQGCYLFENEPPVENRPGKNRIRIVVKDHSQYLAITETISLDGRAECPTDLVAKTANLLSKVSPLRSTSSAVSSTHLTEPLENKSQGNSLEGVSKSQNLVTPLTTVMVQSNET